MKNSGKHPSLGRRIFTFGISPGLASSLSGSLLYMVASDPTRRLDVPPRADHWYGKMVWIFPFASNLSSVNFTLRRWLMPFESSQSW